MIPRTLRNFSLFVDERGYAGKVEELTLPKLSRKTEEHRGGGMAGPIELDMGLEKLEAEFTLAEYSEEILRLWGLTDHAAVSLRMKGAVESQDNTGTVTPVEVVLRGRWREMDFGNWKGGEKAALKVSVMASYYQYNQNGVGLIEIDMVNMIEKVNGIDRLAAHRAALGM